MPRQGHLYERRELILATSLGKEAINGLHVKRCKWDSPDIA